MLSRRRFVTGVASGVTLSGMTWPLDLNAATAARQQLANDRRSSLLAALAKEDSKYDPFAKMLVASAADGPGYHTSIKTGDVHATRPSLNYAAALLDTGERARMERAQEILRVVIGLQDTDPASKTYGVWPWYLEEPIYKMSPADLNWADFCGTALLMMWILNRDKLGEDLADKTRSAITHAARSTQRREVNPADTHIAILGTSVTLLAAQEFKLPDLRAYAKERLRKLYDHVIGSGSFTEYNSPTYTIMAIQELSRMLWLVRDSRDHALIRPIHDLAWKHVATHFHASTQQWAGPHSRADETDLRKRPSTLAFLQAATSGKANFNLGSPLPLSLEAYRLPLECPRKWAKHFTQLDSPRQVVETFVKREPNKPGSQNPIVGTTWLHPRFTLGSVNRGDFWEQRRPLVAYWGTAAAPRYLRVRFLKDDRDFSSALFCSVQHQGSVLAAVMFATDHGDSHPTLDPIEDGTIRARDLRLRFEFGGEGSELAVKTMGDKQKYLVVQDRDTRWVIRPVADAFGKDKFKWDLPDLKLVNHIDAVAYQGEEKSFKLAELEEAFAFFTVEEWPLDQVELRPEKVEVWRQTTSAEVSMLTRGKFLGLKMPTKPQKAAALCDLFTARIDNPLSNDHLETKPN